MLQESPITNEIIKSATIIIGAAITAFVAIVTATLTVFGGAIADAWRNRKKNNSDSIHATNNDRIIFYAPIFQRAVALVQTPQNNIDRILVLRSINGSDKPTFASVVFSFTNDGKFDRSERYRRVDIHDDEPYQQMLEIIKNGHTVSLQTKQMAYGLLKRLYENEGVKESRITMFDNIDLGQGKAEICYLSISTFSAFVESDELEISLFFGYAKAAAKRN